MTSPLFSKPLCIGPDTRVVVYQGSFDPPHRGHVSAALKAINETKADYLVVMADDKSSVFKERKASWLFRKEMLKAAFSSIDKIAVALSSAEETKKYLIEKAYTILLIGNDVWPRYVSDRISQCPFHAIAIAIRDCEDVSVNVENKDVIVFKNQDRNISSTMIREKLNAGVGAEDIPDLDPNVYELIKKSEFYSATRLRDISLIKERIALKHPNCFIQLSEPGLSGDLIFSITPEGEKEPICMVKAYRSESDYQAELRVYSVLNKVSSQHFAIPALKWHDNVEGWCLIAAQFISGGDMGAAWKQGRDDVPEQAYYIGRSLAELHLLRSKPANEELLECEIARLTSKVEKEMMKKSEEEKREVLREFCSLKEAYKAHPGPNTYIQGDANPGNFFVSPSGQVTYVDLSKMGLAIGEDESPKGFPAHEIYQFISSLGWFAKTYGADPALIEPCKASFLKGYAEGGGECSTTPEAIKIYEYYWALRQPG